MVKSKLVALTVPIMLTASLLSPQGTLGAENNPSKEGQEVGSIGAIFTKFWGTIGERVKLDFPTKSESFKGDTISMKLMTEIMQNEPQEGEKIRVQIDNEREFVVFMAMLYRDLPSEVAVTSQLPQSQLKAWHSTYKNITTPSVNENVHLLADYNMHKDGNKYIFTDKSHKEYSAKTIKHGVEQFSKAFAEDLKKKGDLSDEQKLHYVYDYIYSQFKYEAKVYQDMLVGNAPNYALACNGFSRLFYELATASGLEVKMVRGSDHFWNQWKAPSGEWVTIDLASDIILKDRHGATGLSRTDHLSYVSGVGFYFATPIPQETNVPTGWTPEQKNKFLTVKY